MSQQRPFTVQDDILEVLEKLPRRLSQTTVSLRSTDRVPSYTHRAIRNSRDKQRLLETMAARSSKQQRLQNLTLQVRPDACSPAEIHARHDALDLVDGADRVQGFVAGEVDETDGNPAFVEHGCDAGDPADVFFERCDAVSAMHRAAVVCQVLAVPGHVLLGEESTYHSTQLCRRALVWSTRRGRLGYLVSQLDRGLELRLCGITREFGGPPVCRSRRGREIPRIPLNTPVQCFLWGPDRWVSRTRCDELTNG